ncbi:MAG: FAD binding domain-containing protein [Hungatella sp.]
MFKARNYVKAASLEEAYELNQKKSTLVIGGMLWVKMANYTKMTVVDLSGLGLDKIEETEEAFRIGCVTTLRALELHDGLNSFSCGVMKECTRHIVGVQFRNSATVGGSIYGRYGFSDLLTAFLAFDTEVELYKGGIVSLREFAQMPYDNDILVRIILKKTPRKAAYVSQRQTKTDFPLIAVAVSQQDKQWVVSVGARPSRAKAIQAEDLPDRERLIETIVSQYDFGSNLRAGKEYRRDLAKIYIRRLMEQIEEGSIG